MNNPVTNRNNVKIAFIMTICFPNTMNSYFIYSYMDLFFSCIEKCFIYDNKEINIPCNGHFWYAWCYSPLFSGNGLQPLCRELVLLFVMLPQCHLSLGHSKCQNILVHLCKCIIMSKIWL